jgi:RNA polymerase sigma factor (sigma-70 family)
MAKKEKRTRLPDDDEVLELLAKDPMALLELLYTAYMQLLLRITYSYLAPYLGRPSPEDVEDCLSAFLVERFPVICIRFDPAISTFRTFFNFCLRRHCLSTARRILERHRIEVSLNDIGPSGDGGHAELDIPDRSAENNIEQVTIERDFEIERIGKLRSFIDELDDESRKILFLSANGLKSHEIGDLLKLPPGTVRVKRMRIIERLRNRLGNQNDV